MKALYLTFFATMLGLQVANAQLSLTKAANDPVAGNTYTTIGLDTTNALPNTLTGSGVTWSVTGVSITTDVNVYTYSAAASMTETANYPGCTIVRNSTIDDPTYLKQTATTLEIVGLDDLTFSDPAVILTYPVLYGNTTTDNVTGTSDIGNGTFTLTGTSVSTADGSGTLNINGILNLSNCLRVKSVLSLSGNSNPGSSPPEVVNLRQTIYDYYHSSSRFPVFRVKYRSVVASGTSYDYPTVEYNNIPILTGGVGEKSGSGIHFTAYPNPAGEVLSLHFVLAATETYSVEVVNMLGQTVKQVSLNDLQPGMYNEAISLSGLNKGFYFVKLKGTASEGVQKILVQ